MGYGIVYMFWVMEIYMGHGLVVLIIIQGRFFGKSEPRSEKDKKKIEESE